ncbi:MAG: flagellar export protein FliJ [Candidatus Poribacteria bacterium]|nr:flagellar export protein FliJ [Candidatus Poribacteria bacterium]MDP6750973.1 flagellar export protein FliJ [Candidatus Poribacteria bacterium]
MQQVLEVRENIEKQRQGEFVVAGQNVTEAEQVFEEMLGLQKNSIVSYREQQMLNISPVESSQYFDYFCNLELQMIQQLQTITELKQEEEQKREKLLEASQDKLVIEELEKKEKEQYRRLFQKREQINIDDISTITYNYRQKRQR